MFHIKLSNTLDGTEHHEDRLSIETFIREDNSITNKNDMIR